jgi:hypothetical protein
MLVEKYRDLGLGTFGTFLGVHPTRARIIPSYKTKVPKVPSLSSAKQVREESRHNMAGKKRIQNQRRRHHRADLVAATRCPDCDSEVTTVEVEPGMFCVEVAHDETCPWLAAFAARGGSASVGMLCSTEPSANPQRKRRPSACVEPAPRCPRAGNRLPRWISGFSTFSGRSA